MIDMKRILFILAAALCLCACGQKPVYSERFDTRDQQPFEISVPVPDGNYLVTVILGDADREALTTIKAESRRLCVMQEKTKKGEKKKVSFLVNKRDFHIDAERDVRLKFREDGKLDWDDDLTLEILGTPAVAKVVIRPADADVVTVFLCGDSTVVDQDNEPWASWGQMFPYFLDTKVAVANYGESGERTDTFIGAGRLDKILTQVKPGDYVLVEFGHNDMKLTGPDKNGFGFFAEQLNIFIDRILGQDAIPVLVTPTHRRNFDEQGHIIETHLDYPDGMRHVAATRGVTLIDLHDMSAEFYESLGEEGSKSAFVHYPAGSYPDMPFATADNTHFNPFGAFELARRMAKAFQAQIPALARHIRNTDAELDWVESPYRSLARQLPEKDDAASSEENSLRRRR